MTGCLTAPCGVLQGCGKVVAVRMPRYQDSNRPRGYAHLDFKKAAGLEKALTLNGGFG